MKINCGELIEALDRGGAEAYDKLSELWQCIKQIQEDWTDKNYVEVRVFSYDGDITRNLRKAFPKWQIWWEGEEDCCGENIVLVPADEWNDELKAKISEFDEGVGLHQEKRQDWKLKADVELPYDLKRDVEELKKNYEAKKGKKLEEVIIPRYAFHQWPWSQHESKVHQYFDEVQTVIREWNVELKVNDRRKWHHDDEAFKAKTIEI